MSNNRRDFFARIAAAGAGLWAGRKALAQQDPHAGHGQTKSSRARQPPADHSAHGQIMPAASTTSKPVANIPVEMPDLPKLPYQG
jgi:hypothetical protein